MYNYDVFISYSHEDSDWVRNWLLQRLEQNGLKVCIDFRDFDIGQPSLVNMERAVEQSRKTLLVLTPDWVNSEWTNFEQLLLQTDDPIGLRRSMLPLMLKKCHPPKRVSIFTYANFMDKDKWDFQFERILKAITDRVNLPEAVIVSGDKLIPIPPEPDFAHPYPMQPNFTGRVNERQMLTEWLMKGQHTVFVYEAIGGMGKSALTWAWVQRDVLGLPLPGASEDSVNVAERCRMPEEAQPEGVLWWSFYERDASFAAFLDEALVYGSGGRIDPQSVPSPHDKIRYLLTLLQKHRFLLILDGFERELCAYHSLNAAYQGDDVTQNAEERHRMCINPNAGVFLRSVAASPLQGRVLITSRLFPKELEGQDTKPLAGCYLKKLEDFHPEDAVHFFRAQGINEGTRAEIESVCIKYGYHPLTLRLLTGMIVSDPEHPGDAKVAKDYDPIPELVAREHHILKLAYDALTEPLQDLLSRIAAFRSPMDYEAIKGISTIDKEPDLKRALRELETRGLLFRIEERFDLHPIVRNHAYDRLADREGVHTQLRDYFSATPVPEEGKIKSIEELTPTIELYHHTVRAGLYDEAFKLFRDRLGRPLYYQFGVFQTFIELLHALFPDSENHPPRLKSESNQAWTLNNLANSYALSGQTRRAVPLFKMHNVLREKADDKKNLAIGLGNLAFTAQIGLGELKAVERNLRRSIKLCREIENEFYEAVSHVELGRLLAYKGAIDEAAQELDIALNSFGKLGMTQAQGIVWFYRALRGLLMGKADESLETARRARKLADEVARTLFPHELDFVRAEWLLGWSKTALTSEKANRKTVLLADAEGHLTEALSRCRRINAVEQEPDILLAWARWYRLKGNEKVAKEHAEEALSIADRCEYRLKQADIHNFLAQLALDGKDYPNARKHADIAKERAYCDGPPHYYKPAYEEAERLLKEAGGE